MNMRFAVISCLAWSVCGHAAAQSVFERLDPRQCEPSWQGQDVSAGARFGVLPRASFLANLQQSYRIERVPTDDAAQAASERCADGACSAQDEVLAAAYEQNRLGNRALSASQRCAAGECGLEDARLSKLFSDIQVFVQTAQYREGVFRRTGPGHSAEQLSARAVEVLNDRAVWYEIECLAPAPEPGEGGGGFIIGRSSEDLSRPKLGDREFATISITEDRSAESETAAVEFFVGLPLRNAWLDGRRIGGTGELESAITPYFAVHKTDIEQDAPAEGEVDDVTFGVASVNYLFADGDLTDAITLSLEWETDVSFDSSMTTARIKWEPLIGRMETCLIPAERFRPQTRGPPIRCSASLVADYADVGDPGEKISLQDVDQYTRVGLDFEFDYDFRLTNGNVINLGLGYSIREPVDGDDGDADMISAELLFLPSPDSHFSFGIEYRHGEDLSSLEEQETTLVRVGFRY